MSVELSTYFKSLPLEVLNLILEYFPRFYTCSCYSGSLYYDIFSKKAFAVYYRHEVDECYLSGTVFDEEVDITHNGSTISIYSCYWKCVKELNIGSNLVDLQAIKAKMVDGIDAYDINKFALKEIKRYIWFTRQSIKNIKKN